MLTPRTKVNLYLRVSWKIRRSHHKEEFGHSRCYFPKDEKEMQFFSLLAHVMPRYACFVDDHKLNQTNCCESSRRLISSSACARRLAFFCGVVVVFIISSVARNRSELVFLSCWVLESFSGFFTCALCWMGIFVFLFDGITFIICSVKKNIAIRHNWLILLSTCLN